MEELLIGDQVSRRFLRILELSKFHYKDVGELLEVLPHIIHSNPPRDVKLKLFDLAVHVGSLLLQTLLKDFHLSIGFVHEELIVQESSLVLFHVLIKVSLHFSLL
uniref:Uncharacterized protein n=1 Tax=Strombidium inclinatum TaxID=197538 RepID=A0A7S3IE87_9SPIT